MSPTVSVIIATYNRAERLREALESVAAQTYRDFEVIVVSDGSTDQTPEVVESFRAKVPAVQLICTPHGGQTRALNAGIRAAHGEYVALLDDDDHWMPQRLERQVPILEARPDVGLVYTAVHCTRNGVVFRRQPEVPGFTLKDMVERVCFIHASSVLVRRACFDRAGFFDETMERVKDFDMWLRIARDYSLAYIDEVLADYVQHDENMTRDFLGGALGHLRSLQHVKPLPAAGVTRRLLRRRRAEVGYYVARLAWDAQRYGLAAKHVGLAVLESPTIGLREHPSATTWQAKALAMMKPYVGALVCAARAISPRRTTTEEGESSHATVAGGLVTVLVLLHRSEQAGAAQSLRDVLQVMDPRRVRFIVASPAIGAIENDLRRHGAEVIVLPALATAGTIASWWRWPLAAWRLRQLIRRRGVSLVDVNYHTVAPLGVLAARLARVPASVYVRVIPWLSWSEHWALSRANQVLCVSETVKQALLRPRRIGGFVRLDPRRYAVLPSGRNLRRFLEVQANGVREEFQIGSGDPLIGIAGSLEPNKRQDLFLRIAAEVVRREPRARFLIIGEPNLAKHVWFKEQLVQLRDQLSLSRQVIFTGWCQNMPQVMKALDLYVLLSERDACPGVLIEAMAAGTPVVTSPAGGGAAEVIGNDGAGVVVDSEDPRAYADVIVELLHDSWRRRAMAHAGRQRAERYDAAKTAQQLQDVYTRLAAEAVSR